MKKGFTLVELVSILILLGAIGLLVVSGISKVLKDGKKDMYNSQIENIKLGLQAWTSENFKPNENEEYILSLSQLKSLGYIDNNIKDPITDEILPNDSILKVSNKNGQIIYEVVISGNNKNEYSNLPSLELNGDIVEYVEIGDTFTDKGVKASYNNNLIEEVETMDIPTFNNKILGIYLRKYTVKYNEFSNAIYRNIIVRDTKGPTITFPGDLSLTYDQVSSYDFKKDVSVSDNSNGPTTLEVVNNITNISGIYTIKYIAKDASGNETIKLRNVTIK